MLDKIKYQKRINSLENENEELKEIIKEELWIQFMKDYKLNSSNETLKKENAKLRKQVKDLKKEIMQK